MQGNLTLRGCFATFAVALVALLSASSAQAVPINAIADENLEIWSTPTWSAFQATGVKLVRHVVPYNAALDPGALAEAKAWVGAAEAKGLGVLISFNFDKNSSSPPEPWKFVQGMAAFRKALPQVAYYTAWNEPNHNPSFAPGANPSSKPVLAAEYWHAANDLCKNQPALGPPCTAIAGDFSDETTAGSLESYVTAYKKKLTEYGQSPSIWAIHAYKAIKENNWNAIKTGFMEKTSGDVWITEVGGMVCNPGSVQEGKGGLTGANLPAAEASQNDKVKNLLAYQNSRVKRTYYYTMSGGNSAFNCPISGGEQNGRYVWDSALLSGETARPAYKTAFPGVPAPSVQTTAATAVKGTRATLNGSVNPNGLHTSYHFEWGPTAAYGNTLPAPDGYVGYGSSATGVSLNISGLRPSTTYHYRIVASNAIGTNVGSDQVLKTTSQFDFSGDGNADFLARLADGSLLLYRGNGAGGWQTGGEGEKIGSGWSNFNAILSPGDFTGDGNPDVLARLPDGSLLLYRGNGAGGWQAGGEGEKIGNGWSNFNAILSPGDFTGDGNPDVLARTPDGSMLLYRGNGAGGWQSGGEIIGSGWSNFNAILSPGDFTGDGKPDVLARTPDGALLLYRGNGAGGWQSGGENIGSGWQYFNAILSPGDFTGDGNPDVLARKPDGTMLLYRGNGIGSWQTVGEGEDMGGTGWKYFNAIVGAQFPIGTDTLGVFNETVGDWCLSNLASSGTGKCDLYQSVLGGPGSKAVVGDWNGDGMDTAGVFAPNVGHWCLTNMTITGDPECDIYQAVLGGEESNPVAGDWNGDGMDTIGVFAPSIGHWCLTNMTTSGDPECDLYQASLGGKSDKPVVGDWNGDGIDTIGVFTPSTGQWCLSNMTTSGDPECEITISLGGSIDRPVAGDWNGDGIDTLGVFNPSVGQWCLSNRTTSGTATCDLYETFGSSGDQPVAGDWNGI